jgi:DNA polymerase/3'-5' exonuclease PolX
MATDFKPKILEELDTLRKADIIGKQPFPAKAYATAMEALESVPGPITCLDQVKGVKGIGAKIQQKIEEILTTGKLRAAEEVRSKLPLDLYDTLQGVHGIGPAKATSLIEAGITTLEGLRKASQGDPKLLTAAQKLGLHYYDDALKRIPRAEMKEHEDLILPGLDERFEGTIVGSYRRGAVSSGDIDVLLTLPDTMSVKDQGALFLQTIDLFKEVGYIVDALSSGPTKFLGYCRVEGHPVRRLDLLMIPKSEYACAILYFTGSKDFNVAFRSYALDKGYTLNEHRLQATKEGVPAVPPFETENDIFDVLGLKYVEPTMRRDGRDIVPL